MNSSAVAMNYARILFEVSEENNNTDEILYELKKLDELDTVEVNNLLTTPIISKSMQIEWLDCLKEQGLSKELVNLMKILVEQGHFQYFHEIVIDFKRLYQKKENIRFVTVTTARKLDDECYNKIQKKIEEKFSSFVILFRKVNPDLVGGIIIEYDGKVIDNTIKRQLKELMGINN